MSGSNWHSNEMTVDLALLEADIVERQLVSSRFLTALVKNVWLDHCDRNAEQTGSIRIVHIVGFELSEVGFVLFQPVGVDSNKELSA